MTYVPPGVSAPALTACDAVSLQVNRVLLYAVSKNVCSISLIVSVGFAVMAPSIPVHPVGSQGFKASAQGLGCMGMSAFYKDIDHQATEEESIAVIHRAIELGVTLLDTSDIYGMLGLS